MKAIRYPRLSTEHAGTHPNLLLQYAESDDALRFCGESWCCGGCGLPALTFSVNGIELKAYSSMVAYGNVMQAWRVEWTGPKVVLPESHHADFLKRIWL